MIRVRWTPSAANDLYQIVQHIQQDNPSAAVRTAETLYDGCAGLGKFPFLGRKGKLEGTRELVFSKLRYIVVYEVREDVVNLIRIQHASQKETRLETAED